MISKRAIVDKTQSKQHRRVSGVSLAAIRRWARQIAAQFQPERIILFGSYAYGHPHADSDVDILVVMPSASEIRQSIRLTLAFDPPFPLDRIVRTPQHLRRGLEEGDSFLREALC
jgi:predicted nucleotidyltransferase